MIDYYVHPLTLPRAVEGVSVPNDDGSFDIYINSLLSPARQQEVLEHELRHLVEEHFYLPLPIAQIERQADGEQVNIVLRPPPGKLPCFLSQDAFARWLKTVSVQQHLDLFK